MEQLPMWEQSDTWKNAMLELEENVKYCTDRGVPICTIHFNVYLERMAGFSDFLRAIQLKYEFFSYKLDTYYDNFNSRGDRNAGHFMYYSITLSVVLA